MEHGLKSKGRMICKYGCNKEIVRDHETKKLIETDTHLWHSIRRCRKFQEELKSRTA